MTSRALVRYRKAIFEANDKEVRKYRKLTPYKDRVQRIVLGGCLDEASHYESAKDSVKVYRITKNSINSCKRDPMHTSNSLEALS